MPEIQPIQTMSPRVARDGFERYYAEKIWEWIPGIYKHEDGLAENPHVLRSLVEVMARQAAVARRGIDRLWEDTSIDACDDWAIPYLADLVATRLVHELNRRGRRVDVAKTLYYRRRKGTPVVMEALIHDITGWQGAVVESFRRLGRTRHGLDLQTPSPQPSPSEGEGAGLGGPVTGTPSGGTADLRSSRGADLIDSPFDEYAHTADFRRLAGLAGRYNIAKLNFHLYRLRAFPVRLATPFDHGQGRFSFDPSGRDLPLFRRDARRELGEWRPVREWELPAPIACRLLGSEVAKPHLLPDSLALTLAPDPGEPAMGSDLVLSGHLGDWDAEVAAGHPQAQVLVDPVRGRFLLLRELEEGEQVFASLYHYGFAGEIGAGTYDRRSSVVTEGVSPLAEAGPENPGPIDGFALPTSGAHEFQDSRTYQPTAPAGNVVTLDDQLCLQGRSGERPYLRLVPENDEAVWTFELAAETDAEGRELIIEGLWISVQPTVEPVRAVLRLDGVFDRVVIRHSTLDPGGQRAAIDGLPGVPIPEVALEVVGEVGELVIESSIVGPVHEITRDGDPCSVGRLVIRDSIVSSGEPDFPALATRLGDVHLERVTVFGGVLVNRLHASEALIQGLVRVTDNQRGCFRFSAADAGPSVRLPPQFESHLVGGGVAGGVPNHFFESRRFGDPGYARLSATAPESLRGGGENRSEIGAWNRLFDPIKRQDLEIKVREYMPFGLVPQFIFET